MLKFVLTNKNGLLTGLLFILAIVGLGTFAHQNNFKSLLLFYLPAFLLYVTAIRIAGKQKHLQIFIGTSILARFLLLFAFPQLSDDIYRFIWDGQLWLAGENPFDHLPSYWIQQGSVDALTPELYQLLNSPEYFTIYPPVCQGIFTFSVWCFPNSYWAASVVMKLFLIAFEVGSITLMYKLLKHFGLPQWQVLLYALNPLVIIEISGNLHFEGAMVFFFLLAVWCFCKSKELLGALGLALSIASKLLPLLTLPLLINVLGWRKAIKVFAIIGIALLILFAPLYSEVFVNNFSQSLDLYFQKFEFNASIYYLIRAIGNWIYGYNIIHWLGPILALTATLIILYLSSKTKRNRFQQFFAISGLAFCVYLFLGTTIHPWYLIFPLALFSFTDLRFIYIWSLLIFGTYMNYSNQNYLEQYWWVAIEYLIVFLALYRELFIQKKLSSVN